MQKFRYGKKWEIFSDIRIFYEHQFPNVTKFSIKSQNRLGKFLDIMQNGDKSNNEKPTVSGKGVRQAGQPI